MNRIPRAITLSIMVIAVLFPLLLLTLWALSGSWVYPDLFPSVITLDNLISYLERPDVKRCISNSIELSLLVTAGSLILGYFPSKVLGTMEFRGKTFIRILVMLPALTPGICVVYGMIPVFIDLDIYRTYTSIFLGQITFTLPYMILTLSSVFENYDETYEEQSLCLGVGKLDTFLNVTLPRIKSGVAIGCMYTFMVSWSMYLLTYELAPMDMETMITRIMPMLISSTVPFNILAATALIFFIPSLIFLFISTQIIKSDNINTGGGI